jgi:hypothetical protein
VTGLVIVKILGATTVAATAVDVVIAVAEMSATAANVAAAVRVLRFAACAAELVVTPVAIVTVHCVPDANEFVATVSVMVAVAVPEFDLAAVNVVLPHPLADGVASVPNVKVGNTSTILSLTATGALVAKVNATDDVPDVTGFTIVSTLCLNAGVGATTAVDAVIAVAATFAALAIVTATVRVARLLL